MKMFDVKKWIREFIIHHSAFSISATAGFLLSWQTVWILRPGMLGGVTWPLATIGVYASDAVLLVAALVGCVRRWRSDCRRLTIAFAVLVVAAVVNTWVSADPWLSAVGWARLVAVLLAASGLPYSERATRAFLGGFVVAMLGHVALGLWQFMTLEAQPSTLLGIAGHNAWTLGDAVITAPGERWLRAYGGFPHPNVLGTALLVALLSLLVISTGAKRNGEISVRSEISRLRFAALEMTMWVVCVFALVLTFSRAALLGLVVLLVVLAWRAATRRFAVIGALAIVAAMAITWPFWTPRFTGSTPNERRSIVERTSGVEAAIEFANFPPFLGIGLHAMPKVRWEWRPQSVEWKMYWPLHQSSIDERNSRTTQSLAQPTHSVPLLALAEIGPIGVLVLVLVLVTFLRHSSLFPLPSSLLLFPLPSYLLPFLPSFLFDHHLWSLPIGLALVFVLAVATSHRSAPTGDSQ